MNRGKREIIISDKIYDKLIFYTNILKTYFETEEKEVIQQLIDEEEMHSYCSGMHGPPPLIILLSIHANFKVSRVKRNGSTKFAIKYDITATNCATTS